MKFVVHAVLGASLVFAHAAFAAAPASAPAAASAATNSDHVKAVQDLLAAMQIEKVMRGVAGRSRYPNEAMRKDVFAKLDKVPPAEIARRMAPSLVPAISTDTALEMTRFYTSPYGKKVLHDKYNSGSQIMMPGMVASVPAEEKKERKRAAYVQASKELAAAEPAIDHEAFKLLQVISKEKR